MLRAPTLVVRLLGFHSLFSGLDKLHNLTTATPTRYEVRVDLETFNESAYAVYDFFQVGSSKERYKLTVGKYNGTAGKQLCRCCEGPLFCGLRIGFPCALGLGVEVNCRQ